MPLITTPIVQQKELKIPKETKTSPANPLLNSLLGAYSDDDSSSNDQKDEPIIKKPTVSASDQYKLPGIGLAFAPIKMDDDKDKMDEELKRFMAEIGQ